MRIILVTILSLSVWSCSSVTHTLKYGYLPGGDYKYYAPINHVDLDGQKYNIRITDGRVENRISCYQHPIPRDTELENEPGLEYFKNYMKAMIESNNGVMDQEAEETIDIQLKALSGNLKGVGYGHVYGLVEFEAVIAGETRRYCSAMVDGDDDAPLGKFSLDTRKGAFRKLVSGSTRRALELFIHDLVEYQKQALTGEER